MWDGPFDEFLYRDVDTVVLAPVDFACSTLAEYGFVTSHSNLSGMVPWVWKPSIASTGALTREQINYAAKTGFIASKKSVLPMDSMVEKVDEAVALLPHMELRSLEQPLLNYLAVTSGERYTSLLNLFKSNSSYPIMLERWAGLKKQKI